MRLVSGFIGRITIVIAYVSGHLKANPKPQSVPSLYAVAVRINGGDQANQPQVLQGERVL